MSVRTSWFILLCKYSVSLLICCLLVFSIIESEVLNSIIVEVSVSLSSSVRFCFILFCDFVIRCIYVYNCCVFLMD